MCSGWFCKHLMNSVTGWPLKQISYTAVKRGNLNGESERTEGSFILIEMKQFDIITMDAAQAIAMF